MTMYTLDTKPLVVGRTPSLPLGDILEIFRAPDPLEELRRRLRNDAFVRAAVSVASPSLYAAMCDWLEGRKLKNSGTPLRLLAYIARMSTRPTPFGFFASIGAVEVGPSTTIALSGEGSRQAQTRADMGWLLALAREVEDDVTNRLALTVVLNPCILERAGRLHVMNPRNVRADTDEARHIEHTPISLKKTAAVEFVMQFLHEPRVLREVVHALAERFGAEREQAEKLVDQLWQGGLFISELRPNPCGDAARTLGARLAELHPRGTEVRDVLAQIDALDTIDVRTVTSERYLTIADRLRAVHDANAMMQVDSTHRFAGTLGHNVFADVLHLADAYVRCSRKISLQKYRDAFLRRYEGRERLVPLLELVNPDFGLGPPPEPEPAEEEPNGRSTALLELASRALAERARVVQLDDAEFERLCPVKRRDEAPAQFEVGFQIAADSRAAIDRGEYLVVPSTLIGAIGAGRCVGRFASALGEEIGDRLTRAARAMRGERVVAEMTYLPPTPRSLNVAQRPNPYDYEVPIGVMHGSAATISPVDILVGVRDDRFFLYSQRLEREITVCESHVFNTSQGAPDVCRLLSYLAQDGARTFIGFDWADAFRLPVLPRVVHGRVVLSPMIWHARRTLFDGPGADVAEAVASWRAQWNLPSRGYLRDKDQWLLVDFTSGAALEMLQDQLKRDARTSSLRFCEALPDADHTWLTPEDGGKAYITEFVASVSTTAPVRSEAASRIHVDKADRRLGPDSEWLYVKLYAGPGQHDMLIAKHVAPLIEELYRDNSIDRAFFLRYRDPDFHLRIRLRRTQRTSRGDLFERLMSTCGVLLGAREIDRYAFDTYERELERYGGHENIDDVEEVFSEDSARCLPSITAGTRTRHRKTSDALLSIQWLLDGLLERSEYRAYLDHCGRPTRKLSAEDWTLVKAVRTQYVHDADERPAVFERIIARLEGETERRYSLLDSLLHMHCNRLGLDSATETRAMEILWHIYSGLLAQQAAQKATVST